MTAEETYIELSRHVKPPEKASSAPWTNTIYVFDLDGTLRDDSHRYDYVADDHIKNYDRYNALGVLDKKLDVPCRFYEHFHEHAFFAIVTASPRKREGLVHMWREAAGLSKPLFYLARPEGCELSSPEFKRQALRAITVSGWKVELAFDDRRDVIGMYREEGIPAVLVTTDNATGQATLGVS